MFRGGIGQLKRVSSAPPSTSLSGEQNSKGQVKKSSEIVKLDPRMIDGLLCVGGSIANGLFQQRVRHPAILTKSHHIVSLIIRHNHYISGHSGVEHVFSLMREKFWIVGARTAVRRYLNTCVSCKRRQAHVGGQKMAEFHRTNHHLLIWESTALARFRFAWKNKSYASRRVVYLPGGTCCPHRSGPQSGYRFVSK